MFASRLFVPIAVAAALWLSPAQSPGVLAQAQAPAPQAAPTAAPPPATTAAPQAATPTPLSKEDKAKILSFLPGSVADEAQRYLKALEADSQITDEARANAEQRGFSAAAQGDQRSAINAFRAALSEDPSNTPVWIALSNALLALQTDDYEERYRLPQDATAAALNAFETAPDAALRAEAVAALARALERRQLYRPAIEAYKASLALNASPSVQAAYDKLRRDQGFRVVDYTVDSDALSPRLCIRFSEPLARVEDGMSKFVTVNEKGPGEVQVEERQICIDGLQHGERYRVGLRAGIPSVVDEVLDRPATFEIYVRDRTPSVRFSGKSFVLPPLGAQTIPVVSVNTPEIELELFRIGDRSLANAIVGETFLSQLDSYQATDIEDKQGEKIWSGKLGTQTQLNREVTTGFPVTEVLKERKPGVYVLRARPSNASDRPWNSQATQWFVVSDIGLASASGTDGLHVFARSLSTAQPLDGVQLRLIARNNEVLGQARTDANGHAQFAAGMTRGTAGQAPALVTASFGDSDFGFIDLTGPAFDLSDRGVAGRNAPGATDVFLYTERGIYRPGETVHIAALMRDATAQAITGLPLTLITERPDGVEHSRANVADGGEGGHALDVTLPNDAMRGSWQVKAYVDPKAPALAQTTILVEDFIPDRLELELTGATTPLKPDESFPVDVAGRFLYGAPAAELSLEGDLTLKPAAGLADYPGYSFGLADEKVEPVRRPLADLPKTDADGKATVDVTIGDLPTTTHLLQADVALRLREPGGRAIERIFSRPLQPETPVLGIKPRFEGGNVGEGDTAQFDVIALTPGLQRAAVQGARWSLYQIEKNFQWYMTDGRWNYEPVTFTKLVANGTVDVPADRPALIEAKVDWGRYRLEVTAPALQDAAASVEFDAGWYVEAATAETPDLLEVSLDKPAYRDGDTARLKITPRFPGIATIAVMSDRLITMKAVEVGSEGTVVELPVDASWRPGAYVTASLYRPADVAQSRMPSRAIGLAWLSADMSDRRLTVALDAPETTRPKQPLQITARVTGAPAGEEVYLTLAAVDVGILNLTRYQPPSPDDWYYGQRRLGMDLRDIYGQLIDSMSAAPGSVRSGGDAGGATIEGSPPTQPLVASFSGIVKVGPDGTAPISFDIPQFNGTARLMAVAWSKTAVGQANRDVIIRDPVVVSASVPRFLSPNDEAQVAIDITNTDGPAGDYRLQITSTNEITVDDASAEQTVSLAAGERKLVHARLKGAEIGLGIVTLSLNGNGLALEQELFVPVQPGLAPTSRRLVEAIPARDGTLSIGPDIFRGTVGNTGSVQFSVMRSAALDVPSLLLALDRYPYGCAEQLTSRALPLLYFNALASEVGVAKDGGAAKRITSAIGDILTNQSSTGSFGLWSPGSGDLWLDSYVTDFLTRAREAGYAVPDLAFSQALDNLQNSLSYSTDLDSGGAATAYALYVLARNRRAAIGDLRYYADAKLDAFQTPLAKAQLGAALSLYGERERATQAFSAAVAALPQDVAAARNELNPRTDYGSALRDAAGVLALMLEVRPPLPIDQALVQRVSALRAQAERTSTQEEAWLLLAAHGLMGASDGLNLELGGSPVRGSLFGSYEQSEIAMHPIRIANRSDQAVDAVLTVTGIPDQAPPAGGKGFTIKRTYYDMAGNEVSVDTAKQNDRFVVVLEVTEENELPSRVLVVDRLPAGFEIDNPRLVGSADLSAFDWLPENVNAAHVEFRSDRFVAAFDRSQDSDRDITLAYVVRAVTPGRYIHPAAMVEDMYRPELAAWTDQGRVEVQPAQ
ncbi:alpha-2-macroglobulin family protein [Rhodoligotrophos defluvii]|uniref:alpha-2-macroglobulin family protein n=1 Tax=Rhodoligotrophos defluvii TaxID=2561934 RepID=UPI0010CA2000|nr:alpha-2-macroglobulin [Rhodoligotrophos defluvii]